MSKQKRGRNISVVVYDLEREESLSRKTTSRNRCRRIEKLRKIDPEKMAGEIIEMIERSK